MDQDPSHKNTATSHPNIWILGGVYGLACLHVLAALAYDFLGGGDYFHQGDWLIHNQAGFVRRGLMGSALLALGDWSGLAVLKWLVAIQAALVVSLYGGLLYWASRRKLTDPLLFLLISPAFFLFWSNDTAGSLRKEMLAYAAFLPLLFTGYPNRALRNIALIGAALLFSISVFAHEANIFIAHFFALALWMAAKRRDMAFWLAFALTALSCLTALWIALHFTAVSDPMLLCQPLLDRGFKPEFCKGAIFWAAQDLEYAQTRMQALLQPAPIARLGLVLALSLVGFWGFTRHILEIRGPVTRNHLLLAGVLGSLFMTPLFVVAYDWGRWVSLYVCGLTLTCLVALSHAYIALEKRSLSPKLYLLMLLFSLGWGFGTVGARFDLGHGFFAALLGNALKILGL